MITLNLLSEDLKKKNKIRRIYIAFKKISCVLILVLLLVSLSLLFSKIIMQNYFNTIVEQTTLVTKNSQGFNNKVKEINYSVNYLSQIQNDFTAWTVILKDITERMPNNITLSSLKLNKDGKSIIIKGRAATRESLLSLKDKLNDSPYVENIEIPLKDILEKENINFEISANLILLKSGA
jgi:Tfp pilus assembly protein PilN